MVIGLIDVIDWQTIVDFRTGQPIEVAHPLADLAAQVCAAHPYPGDLTADGTRWVTDTALDLNARYAPEFMLLSYAGIYLQAVFRPQSLSGSAAHTGLVFEEIRRFIDATGFEPVIVGLGNLMPFRGYIETTDLEGLASAAGMNTRCAGLFGPSERDRAIMARRAGVERIVSREGFRAEFGGSEGFYSACPDYLVVAEPGYVFRGVNVGCRSLFQVARPDRFIPIHTSLPGGDNITDVADLVLRGLAERRVALILVEGVGWRTFPFPFRCLYNGVQWFHYTIGPDQYLALTSGLHFGSYPYPPGYRYELYDEADAPYPFSGIFREIPAQTIGRRFAGRSAAVGSRSILTHLAAGTDITVECFARALYNHGVMAVLNL